MTRGLSSTAGREGGASIAGPISSPCDPAKAPPKRCTADHRTPQRFQFCFRVRALHIVSPTSRQRQRQRQGTVVQQSRLVAVDAMLKTRPPPDHLLQRLEIALLAENPRPSHRSIEHMVRISSAGNSDSSWHAWRLSYPSRAVNNKDSRPLYSPRLLYSPASHFPPMRCDCGGTGKSEG